MKPKKQQIIELVDNLLNALGLEEYLTEEDYENI